MPSSRSCSATSRAQLAKPKPPSGWSDAPAGIAYGLPPASSTEASARCQLSRMPMSNPAGSMRMSPPMIRVSWMLPTLSYTTSGQSTHRSCTVTALSPRCAATPVTARVWLDWTPPIETRVSHPCASASATRYSSLRTLLPPNAMPELQSSRFAQISTPLPRCSDSRRSGWTGECPNSSGVRGKSSRPVFAVGIIGPPP